MIEFRKTTIRTIVLEDPDFDITHQEDQLIEHEDVPEEDIISGWENNVRSENKIEIRRKVLFESGSGDEKSKSAKNLNKIKKLKLKHSVLTTVKNANLALLKSIEMLSTQNIEICRLL
ncbi:hypothetical protein JTB14_026706 [Gonioctena quinquepunctata]|nr:hypothetical protein JTB14_026706 [Gonioctena quinquepunctata]